MHLSSFNYFSLSLSRSLFLSLIYIYIYIYTCLTRRIYLSKAFAFDEQRDHSYLQTEGCRCIAEVRTAGCIFSLSALLLVPLTFVHTLVSVYCTLCFYRSTFLLTCTSENHRYRAYVAPSSQIQNLAGSVVVDCNPFLRPASCSC